MNDSSLATKHMQAVTSIQDRLMGEHLDYKEIFAIMDEISHNRLDDTLTAYFMASALKDGFTSEELFFLTKAMVETGQKLHLEGIVANKHCVGGISGSRTSMILVPIIAAAGFQMPKTSSRAITTPAGTADVMEVLAPVTFGIHQIEHIVQKVGGCIVWGGHLGMAPADEAIIRVEEPLSLQSVDKVIVSIMAKKVASATTHLVLDLPVGKTLKLHSHQEAEQMAHKFLMIGKRFGIKITADINVMKEPAGQGVGAFLEAREVLHVLEQHADRPRVLEEKALHLAGCLLDLCYEESHEKKDGLAEAKKLLESGVALQKFKDIIRAQGGDDQVSYRNMKTKAHIKEILSEKKGTIRSLNNKNLSAVAKILGAPTDKFAGIFLLKRTGEPISKKEALLQFHSCDSYRIKEAMDTMEHFPIYEIEE
ncbi:thymidine phosphorylase [Candidatus Roizmanbacteria bacterium]|nr:thymidine phosphorylase [Candidatus Roizmanbacteria bacterium]